MQEDPSKGTVAKKTRQSKVRLTFSARCRFPDIGARHGAVTRNGQGSGWYRVTWDGTDDVTWMRAEDLEPVTKPEEPNP